MEVVRRADGAGGGAGCRPGPSRRWCPPSRWCPAGVVERTFGWLGRFRRLSQDYEFLPATSEAVIYLVMIQILVHRLSAR